MSHIICHSKITCYPNTTKHKKGEKEKRVTLAILYQSKSFRCKYNIIWNTSLQHTEHKIFHSSKMANVSIRISSRLYASPHRNQKPIQIEYIFENRNQSLRLTLLIVDDPEGRFTVTPRRRWSYSALIQIRCTLLKTKGSLSTVPSLTFVFTRVSTIEDLRRCRVETSHFATSARSRTQIPNSQTFTKNPDLNPRESQISPFQFPLNRRHNGKSRRPPVMTRVIPTIRRRRSRRRRRRRRRNRRNRFTDKTTNPWNERIIYLQFE